MDFSKRVREKDVVVGGLEACLTCRYHLTPHTPLDAAGRQMQPFDASTVCHFLAGIT